MTDNQPAARIDGGFVVKRTVGRVHATFAAAGAEAARLAALNNGEPFSVLQVVGVAPAGGAEARS